MIFGVIVLHVEVLLAALRRHAAAADIAGR
jgi:hypothetical protein